MRMMVNTLLSTWRSVVVIITLALSVAVIFSILAMTLFSVRAPVRPHRALACLDTALTPGAGDAGENRGMLGSRCAVS
jgi:hypothetical protein